MPDNKNNKDNENNKMIHDFDQATAGIRDSIVPMLKSFYDACLVNGFNEKQSLFLTEKYLGVILTPPC